MGLTVAPLTTAVMTSVDEHRAGVASGVNNAVARAASVLAVAALGVVLVARFDAVLDERLAALTLAPDVAAAVAAQRSSLAAAKLPEALDPATRAALLGAFRDAYVAGFRAVMLTAAALAAASSAIAFALVRAPTGVPPKAQRDS
jgi:hypothetical protein